VKIGNGDILLFLTAVSLIAEFISPTENGTLATTILLTGSFICQSIENKK
tara:strand:+ start:366 stop:515 length:150 start_codon:yes stop_codon:yes gene_type:complete